MKRLILFLLALCLGLSVPAAVATVAGPRPSASS